MYRYFIKNQRGSDIDISKDEFMKEFCLSKEDIVEHLQAQLLYLRDGHKNYKIQPVVIGVTVDKFASIVNHLCETYKGFLPLSLFNKNLISIKLQPKGSEIIRIVNSEAINTQE